MMAAKVGSEPLVKLLLSHQADPSITDSHGLTARDIAAKYKRDNIAQLLQAASKS
jgi:ankyrin repeat protein